MKRDCTYPYGHLTRFLMALFLMLILSFLIGCNASITFPAFPIWRPTPRKSNLLEDLDNQLQRIQAAIVRLENEDITILFHEDSVSEQQIRAVVNEVMSSFDKVAKPWRMTVEGISSNVVNKIVGIVNSFEGLFEEEIHYEATVTYKDRSFSLGGEFVFYDIYAKTRTADEIAEAFIHTHQAVLELDKSNVTISDYRNILHMITAYGKLPDAVQTLLAEEYTRLLALRDQINNMLGPESESADLYYHLETFGEAPFEVRIPYQQINTALKPTITLSGNDFGLIEDLYTVTFLDLEDNPIESLDLSKGASTYVVQMEITPRDSNEPLLTTQVIYKIPSVSVGNNETELYTIEEALMFTNDGELFINANTSFASKEVAEIVYGSTEHLLKGHTTLVLPYDDAREVNFNGNPSDNEQSGPIEKNSTGYVRLHVPEDISLTIKGKLVVGALRGAQSTKYQGHVTKDMYSVLSLAENSSINLEYRGQLYALGFIEGKGEIHVLSGGTVFEGMFISSFRGGTSTSNIYDKIFPFDQYTMMQIESPLVIHTGGHYIANAQVWVSQKYRNGDFPLVGPNALITLESGQLQKSFDPASGLATILITDGSVASINDTSVNIGSLSASTTGIAIPFDGTWQFIVENGSALDINTKMALLPGCELMIESGGTVNVTEDGELTVFNPYTYQDNYYNKYPNKEVELYYRNESNFVDRFKTPARLINRGKLNVDGGIAGNIENFGSLGISLDATTTYQFTYVEYNKVDGTMTAGWKEMDVIYTGPR